MSFEMKSDLGDKIVDEFLNAQTKKGTFSTYKCQLKQYLQWTGKTGQELIDIKKADKDFQVENTFFAYRKYLLSQGKSENYATSSINAIRGFYSYFRVPLQFRKQESRKLTERNRTTTDYLFDKEDLAKMALAGNLKERYILLLGKSIGLRASDFIKLTYGQMRSLKLESEPPIALGEIATQKESVKAYPFLDSDAIPIVKAMLEANKDKKDSDRIIEDNEDNLSVMLQKLAHKAGMPVDLDEEGKPLGTIHNQRIRMHCLRKYLIDHISAQAGESQWKQIVGKSISEGAYVSQDQLRSVFSRAMPSLLINGGGAKTRKLIELETALKSVESENQVSKVRIDQLQKTIVELSSENKELMQVLKGVAHVLEPQIKDQLRKDFSGDFAVGVKEGIDKDGFSLEHHPRKQLENRIAKGYPNAQESYDLLKTWGQESEVQQARAKPNRP